ncbi:MULTISPECIES: DUF6708 domain-containing protein [unclassified Gilliamella]|uniref:DUF6708 domain-containing protein n=2 Tax=Gilliamella TaxID=1193503 RepID=UPI00080E8E5B|nr:DUF6708 domain-containing protein [Gilliamella apicola]OCG34116.1 hypothetical protein A9G32_09355 [Gilliamella apicola]OCG48043.1 hypothetical protein A9G26_10970 [Gilliamella apicola]OCG52642.1 hypothetical protein A9G27_09680 [Gilliamella apicola]OCG52643.1 hypothetical protein A9G27_09685 [Gilliamella apicola]
MPSKYQPQVSAWREDLHKGIYTTKLHLSNNKKLRYANDDYCEFSRRLPVMQYFLRCITVIFSLIFVVSIILGILFIIYIITKLNEGRSIFILCTFLIILSFQLFLQMFLNICFAPEDCPIRLNRKTGKVYIYDHFLLYFGSLRTFIRSPFRAKEITVKEFNWADIQGCMTSVSVPLASGGMVRSYRLECVVCEPNTTKVIDHFLLAAYSSLNYYEWMWINSYMAFSDNNLDRELMPEDEFTWPIKVNWPEEIDKKSKASSLEEYQQIDAEYKKIKE